MKKRILKYTLIALVTLYAISWLPFFYIASNAAIIGEPSVPQETEETLEADRVIVLGGLYQRNQPLSELNQERLLAGIRVLEEDLAQQITVSNTSAPAQAMKEYLLALRVPEEQITVDKSAITTRDSCRHQAKTNPDETIILVSHRYHLPRALYLCRRYQVHGVGYPAELIRTTESNLPWLRKTSIRAWRYQREAILSNLAILGFYDRDI